MPTPLLKLSDLHTSFFTDAGEVKAVRKKKGDKKRKGTGTFLFFSDHISTITSQKLQQKILQKLQGELFE